MKRLLAAALLAAGLCGPAGAQVYPWGSGSGVCPTSPAQYPPAPQAVSASGSTGAVTASIAAVAGKTNYLAGFDVSYIGGAAAISPVTITGLLGGTITLQLPLSATGGQVFTREYNNAIPASAANTAITITTTADGTATAVNVDMHGCQY